jgi:hypothetical protein
MDFSKSFGVGGVAGATADVSAAFLSLVEVSADQIKNSKDANEVMASSTEKLANSVASVYEDAQKFKVQVEGFVNSKLAEYSAILAGSFKTRINTLTLGGGAGSPSTSSFGAGPINRDMYKSSKGIPTFAEGGTLGAGKIGIVGEAGPEMVVGPGTVVNAAQMRENFAKMFEEQTKFLVNAKNPFRQALDDVAFTPDGIGGQLPYDKQTGSIIDPNIVKDLSDKSNSWQKSVAMLSDKNTEMAEGMRNSTMGENGQLSQEMISSTNKQLLEALQQMKDGVTQQTMSMAEMLKAMGVSNSHLGKVAMNTD